MKTSAMTTISNAFSRHVGRAQRCATLGAAALLSLSAVTAAAQAPTAAQMIEQLKTQPAPAGAPANAPRTRSLRNLTVEAVNPAAATATATATAATAAAPATAAAAASAGLAAATGTPVAAQPPAPSEPARPSLSLLIQFDFNSARVKPESQQALANLAVALQSPELKSFRFAVEGHTDAQGRADYNQKLSQQRADAVRDTLSSQGVSAARLSPVGKGSSELAKPDEPYSAENRRVRIVNID